jgi:predicted transposase YbfD/YdcC
VSAVKPSLPIIWRYLDEPGQMTWEPNDPVRYHIDTDEAAKAFIDALVRHWGIQNG